MDDKKSLASAEELKKVDGKASLLAAVDYYVSLQSDIFISASPGNMHNALVSRKVLCWFISISIFLLNKTKVFLEDQWMVLSTIHIMKWAM